MSFVAALAARKWLLPLIGGVAVALLLLGSAIWLVEKGKSMERAKQAAVVLKAQERADKLANELVIEQARNMAVTEKVTIEYRDRIRQAPDDVSRLRAIACGLRGITSGGGSSSPGCPPDAVPASRAGRQP